MKVLSDLALLYEDWLDEDYNDDWTNCTIHVHGTDVDAKFIHQIIPDYLVKSDIEFIGVNDEGESINAIVVEITNPDDFNTLREVMHDMSVELIPFKQ